MATWNILVSLFSQSPCVFDLCPDDDDDDSNHLNSNYNLLKADCARNCAGYPTPPFRSPAVSPLVHSQPWVVHSSVYKRELLFSF